MSDEQKSRDLKQLALSRRGLFVAGGAVVLAGVVVPAANASAMNTLKTYLHRTVPDLNMHDAELDMFLEEFVAYFDGVYHERGGTILMIAKYERAFYEGAFRFMLPGKARSAIDQLQSQLRRCFMLGTDFLDPERPADQPVRYGYIPDPYAVGCANRLATFDS